MNSIFRKLDWMAKRELIVLMKVIESRREVRSRPIENDQRDLICTYNPSTTLSFSSILAAHHPPPPPAGGWNATRVAPNASVLPFEALFFSCYLTFLSFWECSSICFLYSASALILALYSCWLFWICACFSFSASDMFSILSFMDAALTSWEPSIRTLK